MGKSVVYDFSGTGNFLSFGKQVERGADRITRSFRKMDSGAKRVSASFTRVGKSATALGTKLRTTSLAAGAGIVASAKSFGDFESGLIDTINLLDKADVSKFAGQLEDLSKGAIKMGFDISDSNDGLFNMVSALGASDRSLAGFVSAQRLAIAGSTDLAIAVDGMTTAIGIFGDEAGTADEIANAFFAAQVKGNVKVAGLARNLGKVGAAGKLAGFGLRPLLSAVSAITVKGFRAEVAATGLASGINALLKPEKQAAKLMRQNGIVFGASALRRTNLVDVMTDIARVAKDNPDAMAKMFPQEALKVMGSIDTDAIRIIQESLSLMKTDQLGPAEAKKLDTFNVAMRQTFGSIKLMAIAIGEQLAPGIKMIGGLVRSLTAGFLMLPDSMQKVVAWILTLVAIAAPFLLIFGGTATVIGAVTGAFAALAGVLAAPLGMLIVMASAFLGIPIAIAIVVAAVAGLGVLLFKNWDLIVEKFHQVKSFLGFGGDADGIDVSGSADVNTSNTVTGVTDINSKNTFEGSLTVKAEPGTAITKTKSKSSGGGLNVHTQNTDTF